MRILFLYWGKKGGGAKYSLEISKALSKKDGIELFLSISNQCSISKEFEKINRPIQRVNTYKNVFGFIYQYFIGIHFTAKALEHFLKKNKIDIVIIGMDFFWGANIHKACKKIGAKTIFVVHEPKPHPREPLFMSLVKKKELKESVVSNDHIVTLTQHVKKIIQKKYNMNGDSISVIPHGIFSYFKATERRTLPTQNETITVLYFGRVVYYKGLDILLDAFKILERKVRNIKLEIWGSGSLSNYENKIESIQNIRIENRWISEDKISEIFKKADVCVLPYRDASQSGIVGIACMAGVPIVATPADGLKEQLKETGTIFSNDFTPSSLASSLEGLITSPDSYSKASEACIEYARNLSWSSIAEQFVDLCNQILSTRKTFSDF